MLYIAVQNTDHFAVTGVVHSDFRVREDVSCVLVSGRRIPAAPTNVHVRSRIRIKIYDVHCKKTTTYVTVISEICNKPTIINRVINRLMRHIRSGGHSAPLMNYSCSYKRVHKQHVGDNTIRPNAQLVTILYSDVFVLFCTSCYCFYFFSSHLFTAAFVICILYNKSMNEWSSQYTVDYKIQQIGNNSLQTSFTFDRGKSLSADGRRLVCPASVWCGHLPKTATTIHAL